MMDSPAPVTGAMSMQAGKLEMALQSHQAGRLQKAEKVY
jgi:hypothetical protein